MNEMLVSLNLFLFTFRNQYAIMLNHMQQAQACT